jgi:hypothetical protein
MINRRIWAAAASLTLTGIFAFLYFGGPAQLLFHERGRQQWTIDRTPRGEILVWRVELGPTPVGPYAPDIVLRSEEVVRVPMWPFLAVSVVCAVWSLWYIRRRPQARGFPVEVSK